MDQISTVLLVRRFANPGLEGTAVHAVGDAVVFPGEIVKPLPDKAAMSPELVFGADLLGSSENRETFGLAGSEIGLEDDDVGFMIGIVIGINSLAEEFLAGGVLDVDFAQIGFPEWGEVFGGELEGLAGAREGEFIGCLDGKLRGGSGGGAREGEGEAGDERGLKGANGGFHNHPAHACAESKRDKNGGSGGARTRQLFRVFLRKTHA